MSTEEIKQQLDRIENSLANQKEVLTLEEAAQYTGFSKSYLYKLTSSAKSLITSLPGNCATSTDLNSMNGCSRIESARRMKYIQKPNLTV